MTTTQSDTTPSDTTPSDPTSAQHTPAHKPLATFDQGSSAPPIRSAGGSRAEASLHFEVEHLYYAEALALDERRFADWLAYFTEDLRYWMPIQTNRLRRQQKLSILEPGETAYYDETRDSLAWRIRRFDSGMAWAEDPPSRTRHYVSNVIVTLPNAADPAHESGDLVAQSYFLVYRNRLEHETGLLSGGRTDLLRRVDGELKVCRRTIILEANVLHQKNLSTFF